MPINICKVLLIEDNPVNAKFIGGLLRHSDLSSLAKDLSFDLTWAQNLAAGIKQLTTKDFDVIVLDLMLPDKDGIDSLLQLKEEAPNVPIVVHTESEDETLVVKAFQFGALGYLRKKHLDRNLLVYAIRLAIERQQYTVNFNRTEQQKQQELEFQELEKLANAGKTSITSRMFGSETLRESLPDIFQEMAQSYGDLMELALETACL